MGGVNMSIKKKKMYPTWGHTANKEWIRYLNPDLFALPLPKPKSKPKQKHLQLHYFHYIKLKKKKKTLVS